MTLVIDMVPRKCMQMMVEVGRVLSGRGWDESDREGRGGGDQLIATSSHLPADDVQSCNGTATTSKARRPSLSSVLTSVVACLTTWV